MVTVETSELGERNEREDMHQAAKPAEMTAGHSIVEVISKVVTAVLGIIQLAEAAVPLYMVISIAVTVVL